MPTDVQIAQWGLGKRKKKKPRRLPVGRETPKPLKNPFGTALGSPGHRTYKQPAIPEIGAGEVGGIEKQLRDIVLPYFRKNLALPNTEVVAQALRLPTPTTPKAWDAFWSAQEDIPGAEGPRSEDFFNLAKEDKDDDALGIFFAVTGKAGFKKTNYEAPGAEGPQQVDAATVAAHMAHFRGFSLERDAAGSITNLDEAYQNVAFKRMLFKRLKDRGITPKFDPDNPLFDAEFEIAAQQYAAGRQPAYAAFGSGPEKSRANTILDPLMRADRTRSELEQKAEEMGKADGVYWTPQDNWETGMNALQTEGGDKLMEVTYKGWLFGRPEGQSISQARHEYVEQFGENRLPASELESYRESNATLFSFLGNAMSAVGKIDDKFWEKARSVPVVGEMYAGIGWAAGKLGQIVNEPFNELFRDMTALKLLVDEHERGMTREEWVAAAEKAGGGKGLHIEGAKELGFAETVNRWLALREESDGRTPFVIAAEDFSIAHDGKMRPWTRDIGQIADIGLIFAVGGYLDPMVVGGVKGVARGGFNVGRKRAPEEAIFAESKGLANVPTTPLTYDEFLTKRAALDKIAESEVPAERTLDVFGEFYGKSTATKTIAGRRIAGANLEWLRNPSPEMFAAAREAVLKDLRTQLGMAKTRDAKQPVTQGEPRAARAERRLSAAETVKYPLPETGPIPPEAAYDNYLADHIAKNPMTSREITMYKKSVFKHKWFRTNAEVLANIDNGRQIARLYSLSESDAVKDIALAIAKEKDPEKIIPLLRSLEEHGATIDGGAAATFRSMRAERWRNGGGGNFLLRSVFTPVHYGRIQQPRSAANMLHDVATFSMLGNANLDTKTRAAISKLEERMWEVRGVGPTKMNAEQRIIDEYEKLLERNLGEEGVAQLRKVDRWVRRARGERVSTYEPGVSYLPVMRGGKPVEGSVVVPAGTNARLHAMAQQAGKELDEELADAGLAGANVEKLQKAKDAATAEVAKYETAAHTVNKLEALERKTDAEVEELRNAQNVVDTFGRPQPFTPEQGRKHLVFKHDPRVVGYAVRGKPAQAWMIADAAVAQPLMTLWKEMVMASMGFVVRVFAGDEMIRLIPEGVVKNAAGVMATKRKLKTTPAKGVETPEGGKPISQWETDVSPRVTEGGFSEAFTGAYTGSFHPGLPGTKGYWKALSDALYIKSQDIIVRRIVERNGGTIPKDPAAVRAFIKEMRDEKSDLGQGLRDHLDRTLRSRGENYDTKAYQGWVTDYAKWLAPHVDNDILRESLHRRVTAKELAQAHRDGKLPDDLLEPVNIMDEGGHAFGGNPLYALVKASPWHWAFNGLPFEKIKNWSTVGAMTKINNWTREQVFAHHYSEFVKSHKGMDPDELHTAALDFSELRMNAATYTRDVAVFEDLSRNIVPFVSAYRQFAIYWAGVVAKHPVTMSGVKTNYPDVLNDPFRFAAGDVGLYTPAIPFWGPTAEEPGGEKASMAKQIAAQSPNLGYLFTTPMKLLAESAGKNPADYSDMLGLAGLGSGMAPFKRAANLGYGLGLPIWDSGGFAEAIFGDPNKVEKAHINSVTSRLRYGPLPTGVGKWEPGEIQIDKPGWWKAIEMLYLFDKIPGIPEIKADLAVNEFLKLGFPVSAWYSPKEVRERNSLLFDYRDAEKAGDEMKKAQIRRDNPGVDKQLLYYDATPEERVAMRADPANAKEVKWWLSPNDYDDYGVPLGGADYTNTAFDDGRKFLAEDKWLAKVHNKMTDIYGGAYAPGTYGRTPYANYAGDIVRAAAEKKMNDDIEKNVKWARKFVDQYAKTHKWVDKEMLMYQFENPEGDLNFGLWTGILTKKGLDPLDYNVDVVRRAFKEHPGNWGGAGPQDTPYKLSDSELQKGLIALGVAATPKEAQDIIAKTPYSVRVAQNDRDRKTAIIKEIVYQASDQWYWLNSGHLKLIGVQSDARLDAIQMQLHQQYVALSKNYTPGSSEYRVARNKYYADKKRLLRSVPGGKVVDEGLAERLRMIPHFTEPDLVSVGSGPLATAEVEAWRAYKVATNAELAKPYPDKKVVDKAWAKVAFLSAKTVAQMTPLQRRVSEKARVRIWDFLFAESKRVRADLRTSGSYGWVGSGIDSRAGRKQVKRMEMIINAAKRANPLFKRDIETYFDKRTNLASRLTDWYNY